MLKYLEAILQHYADLPCLGEQFGSFNLSVALYTIVYALTVLVLRYIEAVLML